MKTIVNLLLFALLISSNGCVTYSAIQRAKGEDNPVTGHHASEPQPGYYALLPLTIPADIVASPFYLYCYIGFMITGDGP